MYPSLNPGCDGPIFAPVIRREITISPLLSDLGLWREAGILTALSTQEEIQLAWTASANLVLRKLLEQAQEWILAIRVCMRRSARRTSSARSRLLVVRRWRHTEHGIKIDGVIFLVVVEICWPRNR